MAAAASADRLHAVARVSDNAARLVVIVLGVATIVYLLFACFMAPWLTGLFARAPRDGRPLRTSMPVQWTFTVTYFAFMALSFVSIVTAVAVYKAAENNDAAVAIAVGVPAAGLLVAVLVNLCVRMRFGTDDGVDSDFDKPARPPNANAPHDNDDPIHVV